MKLTKKLLFTSLVCAVLSAPLIFGAKPNNGNLEQVEALSDNPTVGEFISTYSGFPTSYETGWQASGKSELRIYSNGSNLYLSNNPSGGSFATVALTAEPGLNNNVYIYDSIGSPSVRFTFNLHNDLLASITTSCDAGGGIANGSFEHPHVASLVNGIEPTCEIDGYKDHYECPFCDLIWADSEMTNEISDFEEWKNDYPDGGYLPSFSHNILTSDSWDGNVLTITVGCGRDGCDYEITKTVTATDDDYVMESPATLTEKEKGHYEIEISEGGDFDGVYTSNSFERGEVLPPLEPENNDEEVEPSDEGLSGGAIAGISIGAVAGVSLLTYIGLFIAFIKTKKAPKFLIKSFEWILKLFTK